LTKEVNKINAALQQTNKNLELNFSVDKATNRQVIKLMDKATGETVVQIPSEAVLAISQGIDEFQQGLLLKQKA
jgi:flagellar protein FlaG